jgi:hypothetical protein
LAKNLGPILEPSVDLEIPNQTSHLTWRDYEEGKFFPKGQPEMFESLFRWHLGRKKEVAQSIRTDVLAHGSIRFLYFKMYLRHILKC